jgi:hypothetical protein
MISSVPSKTKRDIFTTVTVSGDSVLALLQRLHGPRQDPSSPHSGALSILADCLLERSLCPPMFGERGEQPVGRLDIYPPPPPPPHHTNLLLKRTHHSSVVTSQLLQTWTILIASTNNTRMMLVLHIFTVGHIIRVLERRKERSLDDHTDATDQCRRQRPSLLKEHVDGTERVLNMLQQHMLEELGCC